MSIISLLDDERLVPRHISLKKQKNTVFSTRYGTRLRSSTAKKSRPNTSINLQKQRRLETPQSLAQQHKLHIFLSQQSNHVNKKDKRLQQPQIQEQKMSPSNGQLLTKYYSNTIGFSRRSKNQDLKTFRSNVIVSPKNEMNDGTTIAGSSQRGKAQTTMRSKNGSSLGNNPSSAAARTALRLHQNMTRAAFDLTASVNLITSPPARQKRPSKLQIMTTNFSNVEFSQVMSSPKSRLDSERPETQKLQPDNRNINVSQLLRQAEVANTTNITSVQPQLITPMDVQNANLQSQGYSKAITPQLPPVTSLQLARMLPPVPEQVVDDRENLTANLFNLIQKYVINTDRMGKRIKPQLKDEGPSAKVKITNNYIDKAPELEQYTVQKALEQQTIMELQEKLNITSPTSGFRVAYPDYSKILRNFSRSPIFRQGQKQSTQRTENSSMKNRRNSAPSHTGKHTTASDQNNEEDQSSLNQMRINSMNTKLRFGEHASFMTSSINVGETEKLKPKREMSLVLNKDLNSLRFREQTKKRLTVHDVTQVSDYVSNQVSNQVSDYKLPVVSPLTHTLSNLELIRQKSSRLSHGSKANKRKNEDMNVKQYK